MKKFSRKTVAAITAVLTCATIGTGIAVSASAKTESSTTSVVDSFLMKKVYENWNTLNVMDCDADGRVDVYDLILMKQYLLGDSEFELSETDRNNLELTDGAVYEINRYIGDKSPTAFAKIRNVSLNVPVYPSETGKELAPRVLATVDFEDSLTKREMLELVKGIENESGEKFVNRYEKEKGSYSTMRFYIDGYKIMSALPVDSGSLSAEVTVVSDGETGRIYEIYRYLGEKNPSLLAMVNDISVTETEEGRYGTAVVSLASAMTEHQAGDILKCSGAANGYFELAAEGKCDKIRMVFEGNEIITAIPAEE